MQEAEKDLRAARASAPEEIGSSRHRMTPANTIKRLTVYTEALLCDER